MYSFLKQAGLLMEGLATLRPDLIQALLEKCLSVKVKLLSLYVAEKSNHAWLHRLEPSKVNLGKGKRMIVQGGHLEGKYGITVPASFYAEPGPMERI